MLGYILVILLFSFVFCLLPRVTVSSTNVVYSCLSISTRSLIRNPRRESYKNDFKKSSRLVSAAPSDTGPKLISAGSRGSRYS